MAGYPWPGCGKCKVDMVTQAGHGCSSVLRILLVGMAYLGYHTWVLGLNEVCEEMMPWELVLG